MEAERTKLFEMAIASSDTYYKKKDFENAFIEIRRASLLVNNPTEQGDYLGKQIIINDKSANICFNEPKPKYDFFIIYYLVSFALDIARDLTSFPHLSPFYYRKKIQYSPYCDDGYDSSEISPDKDDNMDISLKKLKIFNHRKIIFREYNNFIYNELPIIYGIPVKYGEDSVRRIFDSYSTNHVEFENLLSFSEELTNKNISIIPYKCHDFISKLLQEYYVMVNIV